MRQADLSGLIAKKSKPRPSASLASGSPRAFSIATSQWRRTAPGVADITYLRCGKDGSTSSPSETSTAGGSSGWSMADQRACHTALETASFVRPRLTHWFSVC